MCLCLAEESEHGRVTGVSSPSLTPALRLATVRGRGQWMDMGRLRGSLLPPGPLPLSQGLLPTHQSWDRVLDPEYRRQSLLGPAAGSANLAS